MPNEEPVRSIQPGASVSGVSADPPGDSDGGLVALPAVGVSVPWSGLVLVLVWLVGELCNYLAAGLLQNAAPRHFPSDGMIRLTLFVAVLALPLKLIVAPWVVRNLSNARLADMGITARALVRNALLGIALAPPLALLVYGVQMGCEALLQHVLGQPTQKHLFVEFAEKGLTPTEWCFLAAAVLVAAPAWEEFLFRGLIQPWAISRPWGGAILLGLASSFAVVFRLPALRSGWGAGPAACLTALMPALVALGMVPVYLLLRATIRSPVPAAVFATSVLFGWFHVQAWPSPVPLTLLGMGLGWLAWRGRSLGGPVALHATFNAIGLALLLLEPWLPQPWWKG